MRAALGLFAVAAAVIPAAASADSAAAPAPATASNPISEYALPTGASARSIVTGADGNLWFTDDGTTPAIGTITPTGTITEYSTVAAPGVPGLNAGSVPNQIVKGPDGNLWFTDDGTTPAIGSITPTGTITEYSTGLSPGSRPVAITAGPDGNLWFTDDGTTPAIGMITPATGTITEYTTVAAGSAPNQIVKGPDGNLWFTDDGTTPAIGTISPATGTITEYSTGLNAGSLPGAITVGPDGNLWFTDSGTTPTIGTITPASPVGTITEFSGTLPTGADPLDIVQGADGNLWFTDGGTESIGRMTVAGVVKEFPTGVTAPATTAPTAIAPGPDGNLWFIDNGSTPAIGRVPITPSVQINAPISGSSVPVGTYVATDFSCSAGDDLISSCVDSAGLVSPDVLATGQIGTFTYIVTAKTVYGITATRSITYTVTGTPPAVVLPPAVSGVPLAGSELTCATGAWTELPMGYQTLWSRDGTPIVGANSDRYVVLAADEGTNLTCQVVAYNGAGQSSPAVSPAVAVTVPVVKQCPASSGSLSGAHLGHGELGQTRPQTRRAFAASSYRATASQDTFCLTPLGITVGYASSKLLGTLLQSPLAGYNGRAVWLSTTSAFYAVNRIRVGAMIHRAIRSLRLRARLQVAGSSWYFRRYGATTLAVKSSRGVVTELAVTATVVSQAATARRKLVGAFS